MTKTTTRDPRCTCPLPMKYMKPEQHTDTCPVVADQLKPTATETP